MRLLRTSPSEPGNEDLELIEEFGQDIPKYAVLSHTWGRDEVLFEHIRNGTSRNHEASSKVINAIQQAANDGYEYIWIDSCCIDKSSSAELSEAINSMYVWYERAEICYAILEDVSGLDEADFESTFMASRWFTRGWTLQELLAPKQVIFLGRQQTGSWISLGDRNSLQSLISKCTFIHTDHLAGVRSMHEASISERMSWAAERKTKREEDIAYCLLGLFSVNMPMLYGEGPRAFLRLQEEIMKISDDMSIFAWTDTPAEAATDGYPDIERVNPARLGPNVRTADPKSVTTPTSTADIWRGLLADSPSAFSRSRKFIPWKHYLRKQVPYQLTNRGLSISLNLTPLSGPGSLFVADIQCALDDGLKQKDKTPIGVYLTKTSAHSNNYARVRCERLVSFEKYEKFGPRSLVLTELFVRQTRV
jgi:hypothetical protein